MAGDTPPNLESGSLPQWIARVAKPYFLYLTSSRKKSHICLGWGAAAFLGEAFLAGETFLEEVFPFETALEGDFLMSFLEMAFLTGAFLEAAEEWAVVLADLAIL
jgi:hypothetical protein